KKSETRRGVGTDSGTKPNGSRAFLRAADREARTNSFGGYPPHTELETTTLLLPRERLATRRRDPSAGSARAPRRAEACRGHGGGAPRHPCTFCRGGEGASLGHGAARRPRRCARPRATIRLHAFGTVGSLARARPRSR